MKGPALIAQMKEDLENGLIPTFVVCTLGTTGLSAYDDLDGVSEAVRYFEKENGLKIWIHVDGAYGGPILWIPEKQYLLKGAERVDSLNINL